MKKINHLEIRKILTCICGVAAVGGFFLRAEPLVNQAPIPAHFQFSADWIGCDKIEPQAKKWNVSPIAQDPKQKNYFPAIYLRKGFHLDFKPTKAVIYVTALGNIDAHLNGSKVSNEYFTPGWTDYKKRLYFRAYDVTSMMKAGENVLGAILADGWYRGNLSILGQNIYGKKTRIKMELHLWSQEGKKRVIVTNQEWKASMGPILEADMQAGETYDARLEISGWDKPGFQENHWISVDLGAEFEPLMMEPHPSEPVCPQEEKIPLSINEPRPGVYVFDLGQNFAGWARLQVKERAGTPVVLRFAEMLNADGTIYTANLRSARAVDTYVTRGGGVEIWEPRFVYHGFRYVEVTGLLNRPNRSTITGIVAHTNLQPTGSFECSDSLMNQIYKNAYWGQKSNYFEVPTDCPQRDERMGWSGDTQIFARTGLYNMRAEKFLSKWMVDLQDAQTPEGAFQNMAPVLHPGWSPAWGEAGLIVPYEVWRSNGDVEGLRRFYPAMKKYLEFYRHKAPQGIAPDEGFGDWLAIGPATPKKLIGTAYYAKSASLIAEIAGILGEKEDAKRYQATFEELKKVFQQNFVNREGVVGSGSMTSYLLALRYHLLSPKQEEIARKSLVEIVEKHPDQLCGFVGISHLLPTLTEIGRIDLAYRTIQKRGYPGWGYSIDQGATTIWERWNSYTKEKGFGDVSMNSFNHYAYGACVEWFYSDVLGIEPVEGGYGKIRICPQPGVGLTWAKGYYDSVKGRIASGWSIQGKRLQVEISVPSGTVAELWLPTQNHTSIQVSQRPINEMKSATFVKTKSRNGMEWSVFEVQAGEYVFVLPRS